ncbi:MAG: hypothetical protein SWH61_03280 [Thermodesulfobacteriota bacterium]|nr:hypothetical protein [Thermodesulfobacteriota bacterium]
MTIMFDAIELPDLIFAEQFDGVPVAAVVEQSIINTPVVFESEKPSGRAIDLHGGDDWGWATHAVLNQIKALGSVAGATYTLNYEGSVFTVRFRNEDPPVISAEPLIPRPNPGDGDYYRNVVIRLMEV